MPVSAAERRFLLDQIDSLAQADVQRLWLAAEQMADIDFATYVTQAFPQIVDPYHQMAAQMSATLFESDFPDIKGPVVVAAPLPTEQLTKSAEWALGANGRKALDRMAGTVQRTIYDGDRDTTIANAGKQKMLWVRVAQAKACPFCKLLASRASTGNLYGSKEKALGKSGYHDRCSCTCKAIPAGEDAMSYLSETEPEFADLAQQWDDEYQKARANAGSGDLNKILAAWPS